MKAYVSTKVIKAKPMSQNEFMTYIGRDSDPDHDEPGYLVEYLNGSKPNHPYHTNYISWSPKEAFDDVSVVIGDIEGLSTLSIRLKAERAQNYDRLVKLNDFLKAYELSSRPAIELTQEQFTLVKSLPKLTSTEIDRQIRQLEAMRTLENILTERYMALDMHKAASNTCTVGLKFQEFGEGVFGKIDLAEGDQSFIYTLDGTQSMVYGHDRQLLECKVEMTAILTQVICFQLVEHGLAISQLRIDRYTGVVTTTTPYYPEEYELSLHLVLSDPTKRIV